MTSAAARAAAALIAVITVLLLAAVRACAGAGPAGEGAKTAAGAAKLGGAQLKPRAASQTAGPAMSDEPENPPLVVEPHRSGKKTLHVVRDDLLTAGTKQRAAAAYIRGLVKDRPEVTTILYTAPYNGFGPVAAAFGAARLGLACRLVLLSRAFGVAAARALGPAELERAETVRRARALGASVTFVATWAELVAAGREAERDPAVLWAPLGLLDERFIRLLAEQVADAAPPGLDLGGRRVWVAGGTGALARAIAQAFPAARVVVVPASPSPRTLQKIRDVIAGEPRVSLALRSPRSPGRPPPYPSIAGYDERAWAAAVADGDDGDLVWNVAGVARAPRRRAKK